MTPAVCSADAVSRSDFDAAAARIRGVAVYTPLVPLPLPAGNGAAWLKAESLQPIGSFKLRGAYNKIAQLSEEERSRGVITYSSGNHAQGVAYAARVIGTKAVIVMPSNAPAIKRAATTALGAEIVTVGPASSERKARAEELSAKHGYVVIPPYDDPAIVAGQGTCGLEILADMPDVDLVLAPVSGGGLLSGISTAIKQLRPDVKVYGVEPELAADATESIRTGALVSWPAEKTSRTLADGLRTQSLGPLNFALLREHLDGMVNVSEDEMTESMRQILFQCRIVPEPSGAVAPAALLFRRHELPPFRKAVAVVSGGNVEPAILRRILGDA